jgi:hypothetical protein
MRAASYFRQKPSTTGEVFTQIHEKNAVPWGIEFAVNLISPPDSAALVFPDPSEHAAHRTSFVAWIWPHCSSKGPTVDSRARVFERSRRTRGRFGDLRVMRLEDSAKSR